MLGCKFSFYFIYFCYIVQTLHIEGHILDEEGEFYFLVEIYLPFLT